MFCGVKEPAVPHTGMLRERQGALAWLRLGPSGSSVITVVDNVNNHEGRKERKGKRLSLCGWMKWAFVLWWFCIAACPSHRMCALILHQPN